MSAMNPTSSARARAAAVASITVITLVMARPLYAQQKNPDLAPFMIADRVAEVALARTAAPRSITDSATVLVLARTGFVEAHHGTNGFTCVVFRGFDGATNDPNFWNAKVRAPQCLNPPASRTVLPNLMKRAEWIMAGVDTAELNARTKHAYAAHEFALPAAGAMAYMLSPQQYLTDDDPHWMPHLMFYHDRSMPASAWGAGDGKSPIIDATGAAPSQILVLLVPLPQWSDGTPAALH
ncbi:MAG TPA: hypothetical protein VGJ12_10510 [Gemmatimonadaceae bacterium]|jgi:hypothetical protein